MFVRSASKKAWVANRATHTGYRGRVGVFELLEMTEGMMSALKEGDTAQFGDEALKSPNYQPLAHVALTYAKMGLTTVEEVLKLVEMVAEPESQQHESTDVTDIEDVAPAEPEPQTSSGGLSLEDIPDGDGDGPV